MSVKAIKKIIIAFNNAYKILVNAYIKQLKLGNDDIQCLFDCFIYYNCREFYLAELREFQDKVKEFNYYLISGNFFYMASGRERPCSDMRDFRLKK